MLKSRQMYLIVILRSGNSCSYDIPLVGYLICLSHSPVPYQRLLSSLYNMFTGPMRKWSSGGGRAQIIGVDSSMMLLEANMVGCITLPYFFASLKSASDSQNFQNKSIRFWMVLEGPLLVNPICHGGGGGGDSAVAAKQKAMGVVGGGEGGGAESPPPPTPHGI